jgi:nitroreductase
LRLAVAPAREPTSDARGRALERAVDWALRAPSVHDSRAWRIHLDRDRLAIRAEWRRHATPDPTERELVRSAGAFLFGVRVALAARGWGAEIDRLPRPDDPDLLAEVRPIRGCPDTTLVALEPAMLGRRTNRRRFTGAEKRDEVLRRLTEIAEREGVQLVPLVHESHRRLITRLTRQASRLREADPTPRRGGRTWTPRTPWQGDGLPDPRTDADQTMVLLATRDDDRRAWLRAGEAVQHVLLELTRLGWVACPLGQAVEVPVTRVQLRSSLTWDAHPQMLLRIGRAASTVLAPHGGHVDASLDSRRAGRPLRVQPAS